MWFSKALDKWKRKQKAKTLRRRLEAPPAPPPPALGAVGGLGRGVGGGAGSYPVGTLYVPQASPPLSPPRPPPPQRQPPPPPAPAAEPLKALPAVPHTEYGFADTPRQSELYDSFDERYQAEERDDVPDLPSATPTFSVYPIQQAAPLPPKPFRWRKGDCIGSGAFGRVYKAMNDESGELIAVKQVVVPINSATDRDRAQQEMADFEKEVNLLRTFDHPNIVSGTGVQRYLGTERHDNCINIFLEFVPGGSIASLLSQFHRFNEKVIRSYTRQLLLGLEYLHKHGVMHRDIKGANILVDKVGVIKLADFGASKKLQNLVTIAEGVKSIKGTPYWMAPEVIKQEGHGRQADIWSVACTVIEMATGKPPWSQYESQVAALFRIAQDTEPPPFPEYLSAEGKDFLLKCFNRIPKDRPTATELLRHPFITNSLPELDRNDSLPKRVTPHPSPSTDRSSARSGHSTSLTQSTSGTGTALQFNSTSTDSGASAADLKDLKARLLTQTPHVDAQGAHQQRSRGPSPAPSPRCKTPIPTIAISAPPPAHQSGEYGAGDSYEGMHDTLNMLNPVAEGTVDIHHFDHLAYPVKTDPNYADTLMDINPIMEPSYAGGNISMWNAIAAHSNKENVEETRRSGPSTLHNDSNATENSILDFIKIKVTEQFGTVQASGEQQMQSEAPVLRRQLSGVSAPSTPTRPPAGPVYRVMGNGGGGGSNLPSPMAETPVNLLSGRTAQRTGGAVVDDSRRSKQEEWNKDLQDLLQLKRVERSARKPEQPPQVPIQRQSSVPQSGPRRALF
eukprot:jgi/Chlat1/8796/Chrsp90S00886